VRSWPRPQPWPKSYVVDEIAVAATALNAAANGLSVAVTTEDLLARDAPPEGDVLLLGDLFYERALAERALAVANAFRDRGGEVFVGDPSRSYFPRDAFLHLATYEVPVTRELEDQDIKRTSVWKLDQALPS
jgi:predicted nicotinamide N-methyase